MVDVTPSIVANQQLTQIPFGSLIGAPLNACIDAQAQAAMSSVNFIEAVGLQENPETGMKEAITVVFSFQNANGQTQNLCVPLLAIVPVPFISINTININFKASISASSSTSSTTSSSSTTEGKASVSANYWFVKANFEASYSSKKDSTATADSKYSVEYTMDVNVNAGQADMPAGLAEVLSIFKESIAQRDPGGDVIISLDGPSEMKVEGQEVGVNAIAVSGSNSPISGVELAVTVADPEGKNYVTSEPASVKTDAYGKGAFKLKYAAKNETGQPVEVSVLVAGKIAGAGGEVPISSTFSVLVMPIADTGGGGGNG